MSAQAPQDAVDGGWKAYWEQIEDRQAVFRIEASDYAHRVRRILQPTTAMRVLDFGCGFGHTARELAPSVGGLEIWDASASVRQQAQQRIADLKNVTLLDLQAAETPLERYDLILVHSVVQYMSEVEIKEWLDRWRAMLKPDGRLVLSDLIPEQADGLGELVSYLRFALASGFFWNALVAGARESGSYARTRRSRPLTAVKRAALEEWAGRAGLKIAWLPENLSHRRTRSTAVLQRAV